MAKNASQKQTLLTYFEQMLEYFGPRHWWPGDTPLEIIVGAILTQNTNWTNVAKAIESLKRNNLLSVKALHTIDAGALASFITPAGYYNIKAKRLKNFIRFLVETYEGELEKMFAENAVTLRKQLLSVNGIGPETADSILLYAGGMPTFVVDAYTKRMFSRHKLIKAADSYETVQRFFEENLPRNVYIYNEFHALIVECGKTFCKTTPQCALCPVKLLLR